MKIAFATIYDARDVNRGSGWPHYLCKEFERQGHSVHYVGPLTIETPFETRIFRYLSTRILKRNYRSYEDPFAARKLGQVVMDTLQDVDYDVLLTNDYAIAAYAETDQPVLIYTDAIFPSDYRQHLNPRLDNLSWLSVKFCQFVNQKGLKSADLCIYPAAFAAEKAHTGYGISPAKIMIVPFGANIDDPGGNIAAERRLGSIVGSKKVTLLFVGKDWDRKGGDIAVKTVKILRQKGFDAFLHIVSDLSVDVNEDYVFFHGLLDKTLQEDRQKLDRLYEESDVFIMPSVAEGFGITYVEAAAYGLPSLGYETIGVKTAVQAGSSGTLLPLGASAESFADIIVSWFENSSFYEHLVQGARSHYEKTANWPCTVGRLITVMETLVQGGYNNCE
jgi:glycosyltransferase involved in cell wall biosynthesis